ncbi:MAG TPA: hypothetical protein VLF09_12805 [Cellvibrio sp.]|nr:hypothetical protein [Cellvibrio sp.]
MNKDILCNDALLSPVVWHFVLLFISTGKALLLKLTAHSNESFGWDMAVSLLLLISPFLAYFADSFWLVWFQSLIFSLPLYWLGFEFRVRFLGVSYNDSATALMFGCFMFAAGIFLSGVLVFFRYLWHLL